MQRLRETFRRRQPTLEQQAQQQHHLLLLQQRQQQREEVKRQNELKTQIPQQRERDKSEPQTNQILNLNNHLIDNDEELSLQQITLNVPQLNPSKQIRSVSFDEIRLKESAKCNENTSDSDDINSLEVPESTSRNIRSRSFDSATNNIEPSATTVGSPFLDVPKWKLLIRRSSSGTSGGGSASSSAAGYSGAKDCVHCALMEEYLKTNVSPPQSNSGSFSSEGSSAAADDSDDRDLSDVDMNGSTQCLCSVWGETNEFDEDDGIEPLEGLPIVTLCPPPPLVEVHHEDEEDTGSGITVVSLEVPVLANGKQVRSASVDSPYLLQVPKRTDIEDRETAPKAQRSRSVDIVLPTNPGGPYLIVPPHRHSPITTKKAIQGEIKISTENGETRTLRSAPDWGESAINGDHLWVSTSASGDLCYVGDNECSKQGPRLCCPACKITAHTGCISILIDKIKFHCKPTFRDVGVRQYREQTVIHHHWVHRRHQKGRCRQCGKSFQSKLSFGNKEIVAISCSWCKTAFHNKENCFNMQRIGENCHLGMHTDLVVPPSWIVKLPRRGSFKSSIRRSPKNKRASSKKRTKKDDMGTSVTVDNHLHHQLHALHGSSPPPTKELGAPHRSFAIKPIPSLSSKPLLVFINPKSGGNQGAKLMQKFQWLLNPRQVFDLSQGGPKLGLELYKKVNNLRILACGGDGTAGWVLSVLDEIAIYPPPPISVLPLGTGNDLARALGWGGSYTDEPVSKILLNIKDGEVVQLDRWNLRVERNANISPTEQSAIKEDEGAKEDLPLNVVNNYFSIGVDAHIALSFHEAREAHPERFNSRLRNKMFYGQAGGKDLLQRKWKDLCNYITLECDNIDLTSRLKELKVHSVLFLNIPSYGGGTRPWGTNSPSYEIPRTDDGLIEVIGLTTYQLPLLQAGGHGTCIAQCRSAKIITTRTIPMQVDGEPCRLLPSIINLELRNQANLIAKARSHNQNIHVPTLEKITLKVRKLNLLDYETYHYDKQKLKEVSQLLGSLCIDQNLELAHVRPKINDLMQDRNYSSAQCGADNTCVTTNFVSLDWCFVDSCTAERFFRIDRAQEHLHFVVDICTDDLYILDPENPNSEEKDDIDFFETASQSSLHSVNVIDNNNSIISTFNESSGDENVTHSLSRRSQSIPNNPISVPTTFSPDEVLKAAKLGDLSLLKQLHHKGISLLTIDEKGMSALHFASHFGHDTIVGFLLSAAPSALLDLSEKENGQTALHKAALHRRHNICSMLATCGASLSKADNQGLTAKQLAAKAGDDELAAFLEQQVYVDDLEADEEGIAESLMDDNAIAQIARPGTSLKTSSTARQLPTSQSVRPVTQSGRPLTGTLRPGTQGRIGTMENALKTPRTSRTARPMTSSSGRFVRLGTTSMLAQQDGPFINLARLNIGKYAAIPTLAKPLFEYILIHENNIRIALELASKATEANQFRDWWWKVQLGKCYYKMGMIRDAEKQFRSALKHIEVPVDVFLWLGKVYIRLDQPLAALDVYRDGLNKYPGETFLITYAARIHEAMNEMEDSVRLYREVLNYDAINIEAIASIAMNHFYNDQPEIALRYYRRILQMGTCNAQIYNNLGLCCYLSQQFDMAITCFERSLMFSDSDEVTSDVWYNIGHLALGSGDRQLAAQCFRLALVSNNDHSEAYNNLGVIEMNKTNPTTTNIQQSKAFFQASATIGKHLYEPHYNQALLAEKMGHYDLSFNYVKKCLELYPDHYASQELLTKVKKLYESV